MSREEAGQMAREATPASLVQKIALGVKDCSLQRFPEAGAFSGGIDPGTQISFP